MSIVYVVLFVVWNKLGPHMIPGVYPDKFNCQVATGQLATLLNKDKDTKGWAIVGDPCAAVEEAKKV